MFGTSPFNHHSFRYFAAFSTLLAGMILCAAGGCGWMSSGQNSEGVRLFQQGYYDAAAQRFRQAIQTEPNNPDSYYNLAAYYHRQGKTQQQAADLAQAESYYRQCLDRNPNHIECRRGLAVLLVEQGRSEEAFAMLEDWATQNPTLAAPKIEMARLYEEFGDRNAAKEHLTAALSVSPNDPRIGRLRKTARGFRRCESGPLELSTLADGEPLPARIGPARFGTAIGRRRSIRLHRRRHPRGFNAGCDVSIDYAHFATGVLNPS